MRELGRVSVGLFDSRLVYERLEGGAADEEMSSSSRPRFRPLAAGRPRFAADMLGRSGELVEDQYWLWEW